MKKYIILMTGLLTIGFTSCKKNFLDLQVNPNTPSVTTPQFLLAGALKVSADIVNISYSHYAVWGGYWTSSGNYVPSPQLQQYQFTTDNYQVFSSLYSNLTNFNNLATLAAASPDLGNFQAIAMIMKAYDYQELVDNYNDVPYTQAFNPAITFPAYDKGQAIYDDLVKQLDAAIALINKSTGGTNPGVSDIAFKGNMTNWKKFANTIKLRLAIRQSTKFPTNAAASDLASTASEGYLDESVQAAVNPGFTLSDSNGGQESSFWRAYGTDQNGNPTGSNAYYRANDYFVKLLSAFADPRLQKYFALTDPPGSPSGTPPSIIRGNIFGDKNALQNTYTSAIGPGLLKSASQDAVLMSSAEALFLQAEARQIGYLTTGTAQDYYQRGITASFVAVGLTATDAANYYNQAGVANVNWSASTDKIQAIITQKYISLIGYGNLEAYNEWRRTGFPAGIPVSIDANRIGDTNPSRIFYPTTEYQQNADNVGKEGTINQFTSLIFWAKY